MVEHLATFAAHMTQGLLAASTAVGLEVMGELMQVEVVELAGPKGKHDPARVAVRHGSQPGTVTLGGRRLAIRRLRVRGTGIEGREVQLESYIAFTSTDLLAEGIVARMLAGLSIRRYTAGLEPVGEQVDVQACGTSKSAVSRRFVQATAERLAELLARPLDDRRWLVVFLDGFGMGEHLLVGALGVTADGTKVPLGVVEGNTQNKTVCTRLVPTWPTGAWTPPRGCCSWSTAARPWSGRSVRCSAARRSFRGVVGTRNPVVTDHLPEAERPLVQRRLRAAWANPDPDQAKVELEQLSRSLYRRRPGAAASLREGLEQTLTVTQLGVGGKLLQTLASSNPAGCWTPPPCMTRWRRWTPSRCWARPSGACSRLPGAAWGRAAGGAGQRRRLCQPGQAVDRLGRPGGHGGAGGCALPGAHAVLEILQGRLLPAAVAEAARLLAAVVGQDLEHGTDGVFRIARKVATDRVISTVDPDARHGHKTSATDFDGYKGHASSTPTAS